MISEDRKFIFVHIGRTGGSSLERLSGIDVTTDPRTVASNNTDFPEKHMNFAFYLNEYPDQFDDFFKFTIVRNPYDRMVSAWRWRCTVVKDHDCSLQEFMLAKGDDWSYISKLKLDQCSFHESVKKLDFVARFETLQTDLKSICDEVGLDFSKLPHSNKTEHQPYWEYYDAETQELFLDRYRDEIEYFGYEFGS